MRVVCATGDPDLDDALLRRLPTACPACEPGEVLSTAEREGADVVVLAERLGGEDCLDLAVRLRCGGWRVVWLADRAAAGGSPDRGRTLTLVAVGVYDLLAAPVTPEELLLRLRHPATLADGLAALDGAGRLRSAAAQLRSRLIALAPLGRDGARTAEEPVPRPAGARRRGGSAGGGPAGGRDRRGGGRTVARHGGEGGRGVSGWGAPGWGAGPAGGAWDAGAEPVSGLEVREAGPSAAPSVGRRPRAGGPGADGPGRAGRPAAGPVHPVWPLRRYGGGPGREDRPGAMGLQGRAAGALPGPGEPALGTLGLGDGGSLHAAVLEVDACRPASPGSGSRDGPAGPGAAGGLGSAAPGAARQVPEPGGGWARRSAGTGGAGSADDPGALSRLALAVRGTAVAISASLRRGDRLVPWGDGRFLLLLSGTDPEGAQAAVARARAAAAPFALSLSAGLAGLAAPPDSGPAGDGPTAGAPAASTTADLLRSLVERACDAAARDRERRRAGAVETGVTAFLGALPGCGTTRAALAWAGERAALAGGAAVVEANLERADLACYLLGGHLDALDAAHRARSWWHARGAAALRRCLCQALPGLWLLPAAGGSGWVPSGAGPTGARSAVPAGAPPAGETASRHPRLSRAAAVRPASGDAQPGPHTAPSPLPARHSQAGSPDAGGGPVPAASARRGGTALPAAPCPVADGASAAFARRLAEAVRLAASVAPAVAVDLGAPPGLVAGVAEPRVAWAAARAQVVVVTRPGQPGRDACRRLLTTLRYEAARAGRTLQARVLAPAAEIPPPEARGGAWPGAGPG